MSKEVSSIQLRTIDLMDQRRALDEKIKETAQAALYEALCKIHDALEEVGFNTDKMDVDVTHDGLMFRMGDLDRQILRIFCNRGAGPSRDMVEEWCRKHYSLVPPRDFIRRNRFFFKVIDWEKLLLEETKCNDIQIKGKCPEFNGDYDYIMGEDDAIAIDGKRYHIKPGQVIVLNGRSYTWQYGGLYHDL